MISRFEQFTSAISSIYRYVQKIERDEMEKFGLKGAFAQYLLVMDRYPNGITAAALCEQCDKDKAAVSRILNEMDAKGLVQKSGSGQYRALIRLTEAGEEAARFVRSRADVAVDIAGKGLSDGARKILYGSLELIAGNLQTICHQGIPCPDDYNKSK